MNYKQGSQLNEQQKAALKYASAQLSPNSQNPVEQLSLDELNYLQAYLEHLKNQKITTQQTCNVNSLPSQHSRNSRKSEQYHNPYEYGGRSTQLGSIYKPTYTGPYATEDQMLNSMGLNQNLYWERFPGQVRNVNVESPLLQGEMTNLPGNRNLTEKEINRFELLPTDPQDPTHIVWKDNMPRNGFPTRTDRFDVYS